MAASFGGPLRIFALASSIGMISTVVATVLVCSICHQILENRDVYMASVCEDPVFLVSELWSAAQALIKAAERLEHRPPDTGSGRAGGTE